MDPSEFVRWLGSVWGPAVRGELGPLLALSTDDEILRGMQESGDHGVTSSRRARLDAAIRREAEVLLEQFR